MAWIFIVVEAEKVSRRAAKVKVMVLEAAIFAEYLMFYSRQFLLTKLTATSLQKPVKYPQCQSHQFAKEQSKKKESKIYSPCSITNARLIIDRQLIR